MRINEPVIDKEYVLPEGTVIITHTDAQSHIAYANAEFLRSSGFSLAECIGQPQNIVRHPDMPPEAFADMWNTIRAKKPWCGIVKNRRKDGCFYWVKANVSPMVRDGQIVGYLSVRFKPDREEIEVADALYRAMRAGQARHMRLQEGRVFDDSLLGRLKRLASPSLSLGTTLVVGAMATLFLSLGLGVALSDAIPGGALRQGLLGGSALGVVLALCNVIYVKRRVVSGMQRIKAIAEDFLAGNLDARFDVSGDPQLRDLGTLLSQVGAKVRGVVRDTHLATANMNASVADIAQANSDLSSRSQEAAASLEQTAASIEQITATVSTNTENAQQATQLARHASDVTTNGGKVVGEVASTMSTISVASKKIGEIVGIIDSIAFQTNLLALNAAVEAARAGDQGRGFAVVAQEVRSLAQRSAAAAKEIRDVIAKSASAVDHGATLAAQAEATMADVVTAVKKVATIIADIEGASREQSLGIEQMSQAVTHIDQITQRNATMAQGLAGNAQSLQDQAAMVRGAVSSFSIGSTPLSGPSSPSAGAGAPVAPAKKVRGSSAGRAAA